MTIDLGNQIINRHLAEAEFGIERESLRVTDTGRLAQTAHPFDGNPNIDRDFCENQIEIIGDVFTSPEALTEQLNSFLDEIGAKLKKNGELLWPFSNPPRISGEEEIPVADFHGSQKNKSLYRYYLAEKYGKKKMLFSGIHLNVSLSGALLESAFSQSGCTGFTDFKNRLYLSLAEKLTKYAWLVVYLTAASPAADSSIGVESGKYSSIRCSEQGYWNTFTPILDYKSITDYTLSIARYIEKGDLKAMSELYYPVRVKPRGANSLEALLKNGINHIELRVLDVNPLTRTGIFAEDIRFVHLLLLYLLSLPDEEFGEAAQIKAIADVKAAAVFGSSEFRLRAKEALDDIKAFTERYLPEHLPVIEYQLGKLTPGGSYAEIINSKYGGDYMSCGLRLAEAYRDGDGNV